MEYKEVLRGTVFVVKKNEFVIDCELYLMRVKSTAKVSEGDRVKVTGMGKKTIFYADSVEKE